MTDAAALSKLEVEAVAKAINDARYGHDYPAAFRKEWQNESPSAREYAYRLALAALDAAAQVQNAAEVRAAAHDALLAVLKQYVHDSRLQTFADRERFRDAASAAIRFAIRLADGDGGST